MTNLTVKYNLALIVQLAHLFTEVTYGYPLLQRLDLPDPPEKLSNDRNGTRRWRQDDERPDPAPVRI